MKMEPVRINLREESGFERTQEPVQLGIPIPKGELASPEDVVLVGPKNSSPVCQKTPLAHWPDGSIRWLRLNFFASLSPHQFATFTLKQVDRRPEEIASILQTEIKGDDWHINTGKACFRIPRHELRWFASSPSGSESPHEVRLTDNDHTQCLTKPEFKWQVAESGPVCITLRTEGNWLTEQGARLARFDCSLRFYADSDTAELEICIHNPKRARHPGGLWDLGDPGSVHFRSLTVSVKNHDSQTTWLKAEPEHAPLPGKATEELYLYQDSSGGNQWQSRNHVNVAGEVTTRFRGYKVQSGSKTLETGYRASPVIALESPVQTIQASLRHFWQNFPSGLGVKQKELIVSLFPSDSAEPYELQGGERKAQTAYFSYSASPDALRWTHSPLVPTLDAAQYERAQALPWFKANAPNGPLDELIQEGLEGPNNFFEKREVIDEFGWRNFGDLFADHETLYQEKDEAPLISHYNNQYDAVYGFARQFALTGDQRWFRLMDDLARHVNDIDIYHTQEDRAEYNNGLFWHTDHYLEAHTASHRTFTRHNDTSSTAGQTGGGPGAEHCYTTGLLYHYYLTGHQPSRDSVMDVANWMKIAQEGQGGLLEELLAVKKHELPKLKALLKGQQPSSHHYPFTRATGNYLNTLLDAWHLEPEKGWLTLVERVICKTINPADDIEQRNLLSVEDGWSYLVLLSSIARYLAVKTFWNEIDEAYDYALRSFLHYTNWMLNNERPFLSDPDQLEYVNDTWVAQDIRKAMLMFQAAALPVENPEAFRQQGTQWLAEACNALSESKERHFTRILVILMQNHGAEDIPELKPFAGGTNQSTELKPMNPPRLTWPQLVAQIVRRMVRGLINCRPAREKAWLLARLDRS